MPVKTKRDEEKWEKAKSIASKQGKPENYAFIMGIYKKMKPDYFKDKKAEATTKEGMAVSQIARTILDHMGGRRLGVMLGVKQFVFGPKSLSFLWPNRQRTKGNYVSITLRGDDTYDMAFSNVSRGGRKPVKTYKSLYAEDLLPTFEHQTGWKTRLGSQKQANPFLRSLDPDQERLAEELHLMAENDGAAYQKQDAEGAVKRAIRELQQSKARDLAHDLKTAAPLVVKSLRAQWKHTDRHLRAVVIKKVALQRAKDSPEFRQRFVDYLRQHAK